MEMFVRSLAAQTVSLPAIDLVVDFDEGERFRTEISTKFTQSRAERELAAAGLLLDAWWTDDAGDFAVCLARPSSQGAEAA
jgi:L-histidine N-alpha-methyltransferase